MRIVIDIDSTLHHYWDVLSAISQRRFGIDLPYEEQLEWGTTRLRADQLELCIRESHSDERILAGEPYPGAVRVVSRWHSGGHAIHILTSRTAESRAATELWLRRINLPFDGLDCSQAKVSRCVELGVELLIDDSPEILAEAIERGLETATIAHPWNRELCEEEGIRCARDWDELELLLAPLLSERRRALAR